MEVLPDSGGLHKIKIYSHFTQLLLRNIAFLEQSPLKPGPLKDKQQFTRASGYDNHSRNFLLTVYNELIVQDFPGIDSSYMVRQRYGMLTRLQSVRQQGSNSDSSNMLNAKNHVRCFFEIKVD